MKQTHDYDRVAHVRTSCTRVDATPPLPAPSIRVPSERDERRWSSSGRRRRRFTVPRWNGVPFVRSCSLHNPKMVVRERRARDLRLAGTASILNATIPKRSRPVTSRSCEIAAAGVPISEERSIILRGANCTTTKVQFFSDLAASKRNP